MTSILGPDGLRGNAFVRGLMLVGVWGFCVYLTFTMGVHPRDILTEKALAVQVIEGGNPYLPIEDISGEDGIWSHPRVPGALLLVAPLGWIPDEVLVIGTTLLNVSAVILIILLSVRMAGLSDLWVLTSPLLLLTVPGLQSVRETNLAPLVGLAVVVAWSMASRGDLILAGIPLGVAATMRLFPLWIGLAFLVGGRRRIAAGTAATFAGLNLVGVLLPAVTIAGTLGVLRQDTFYGWPANISLSAMAGFLMPTRTVALVMLGGILLWLLVNRPSWSLGVVAGPMALLAGPVTWPMYLAAVGPLIPGKAFLPVVLLWFLPLLGLPMWPLTVSVIVIAGVTIAGRGKAWATPRESADRRHS